MRKIVSLAVLALVPVAAWSEENHSIEQDRLDVAADTARAVWNDEISEVVVTGTRSRTDIRHLSQTVSVIDRSRIMPR